jgi:hypothetical protein
MEARFRNGWPAATFGIGYTGSWATNDDYTDGSGHKVTSTYAQSTDHTVTLAAQGAGNLLVLQGGLHHTPYEGFRERADGHGAQLCRVAQPALPQKL